MHSNTNGLGSGKSSYDAGHVIYESEDLVNLVSKKGKGIRASQSGPA